MKVHFIAIGGSAMHNLAIALHKKGYEVTGSDDDIFEPSRSRLLKYGLLPQSMGWHPSKLHTGLDAVILGMHAKADNPELAEARKKGLKIFSYPEFLYQQSKNKKRIVIGGSHGKTTITAMILHVFQACGLKTDYMVGAQLEGFEVMVSLSQETDCMILEGDEYLSSTLDRRPKFHLYKPHIALISGIAWDHINVFPTFENYLKQFRIFVDEIEKDGQLVYCKNDEQVKKLCTEHPREDIGLFAYGLPDYTIEDGKTHILHEGQKYPLHIFGQHNLLNLAGAMQVCRLMGIDTPAFLSAIQTFRGASKRLQLLKNSETLSVFKDFAHAPSKVQATIEAVKQQFPHRKLIACVELHTFSSLNHDFLSQYHHTMSPADKAIVFFNPQALRQKRLPEISHQAIKDAFVTPHLEVFSDAQQLKQHLLSQPEPQCTYLFMSSGNFGNLNLEQMAEQLTRQA